MKEFTLTKSHIKLLSKMVVSWEDCEFGAPSINCKRPYGNSGSQIYIDMREILDLPVEVCPHCGEQLKEPTTTDDDLLNLHKELEIALQIVLSTQSFEPGDYIADDYSRNWTPQGVGE